LASKVPITWLAFKCRSLSKVTGTLDYALPFFACQQVAAPWPKGKL
jgi:hypothetical protein